MNSPVPGLPDQPAAAHPTPAAVDKRLIDRARSRFWLAPMAGITDVAYRRLMDGMGAGLLVSELVSTKGLRYGSVKTKDMIRTHEDPAAPVGIQLFGGDPEDTIAAGPLIAAQGAQFIDINLGCPVKKVVKKGCGAALLRDPIYLESFLARVRKGIGLPLTVKMRTGWSAREVTIHECVRAAENAGCEWVAIHGRTREQGYSGKADWDLIAEVKGRAAIPIIGNGDVRSAAQARRLLRETGVDAVMIGRGALRNPWIFEQCAGAPEFPLSPAPIELIRRFHGFLQEAYGARLTLLMLRKFAVWIACGRPGAARFRGRMFQLHTAHEALAWAEEFFSGVAELPPPQFDGEETFMMGGHG
ncbi:MAG: tRNA dihydrouridine synthase [Nitrospinaceae bacterium]